MPTCPPAADLGQPTAEVPSEASTVARICLNGEPVGPSESVHAPQSFANLELPDGDISPSDDDSLRPASFGSLVPDKGAPKGDRLSIALKSINSTKGSLVFGDDNVRDFESENACVVSEKNGRLSFFKQVLQKCEPQPSVSSFVFCLSLLDRSNLPSTNFSTLRSILYLAKKVFPNARLAVSMYGTPAGSSSTITQFTTEFTTLIETRAPADCTVLGPPAPFLAANCTLGKATKDAVFSSIKKFLNL